MRIVPLTKKLVDLIGVAEINNGHKTPKNFPKNYGGFGLVGLSNNDWAGHLLYEKQDEVWWRINRVLYGRAFPDFPTDALAALIRQEPKRLSIAAPDDSHLADCLRRAGFTLNILSASSLPCRVAPSPDRYVWNVAPPAAWAASFKEGAAHA